MIKASPSLELDGAAARDLIEVRGARVHNLRDLDLNLPRGRLIAFCGVSGSGKSSLAFGVLHAEGQRRLLEALASRLRGRLPGLSRPDVDLIRGLPPTIGVSASPAAAGPRSTLATRADVHDLLRALWAHLSVARCPVCGLDLPVSSVDGVAAALCAEPGQPRATLLAPIARGRKGGLSELFDEMARLGFARVRVDGAIHRLDERPVLDARTAHDLDLVVDRLRLSPERLDRLQEAVPVAWSAGKGRLIAVIEPDEGPPVERWFADHPCCPHGHVDLAPPDPALFSFNDPSGACRSCEGTGRKGRSEAPCPDCGGSRLSESARCFALAGRTLPDLLSGPIRDTLAWMADLRTPAEADPLRLEAVRRLRTLSALGLGGLPLGRGAEAISAGEARRLHLASQVSGDLSGVLYLIDEPTAGLGGPERAAVLDLLRELVAGGSSVIVVSHDPLLLEAAELLVELGPGAGAEGGRLLYAGPPTGLAGADTPTARALDGRLAEPTSRGRAGRGALRLLGARGHDPEGPPRDLVIPLGALVVVAGPSGVGKSALVDETLGRALAARLHGARQAPLPYDRLEGAEPIRRIARLSQEPLGRSRRSCVATLAGVWGPLRRLLAETREARVRGLGPETFSFNRPGGRCEVCEGTGVRALKLHLLETEAICERCEGRRFGSAALSVRYRGHNAADLLAMTVTQARRAFSALPELEGRLRALEQAGLGYLRLGQPADTLSGGEAERVRLAREISGGLPEGALYLLETPSLGLHPSDTLTLLALLQELVDRGGSVVAIDDDPWIRLAADHVISLAPPG